MKKPVADKPTPFNLPPEKTEERYEAIQKLAKRVTMLMRDLEVYSLDMTMYAKALAKGNMPRNYVEEVGQMYLEAASEMRLVSEMWLKIFKETPNVADVPDK